MGDNKSPFEKILTELAITTCVYSTLVKVNLIS